MNGLPHMPRVNDWRYRGSPIQGTPSNRRFPNPYDVHPLALFTPAVNGCSAPAARWVHTDNEGKASLLIFTDGSALGNGQAGARAGCGVVYSPLGTGMSFPLERSPDGSPPTSNRAELRAVLAAIELRYWPGEGFAGIVIATDSEYVIKGISEWVPKWKRNGWKTAAGANVKNQDLWKRLLNKVEECEADGLRIQFFQLKREWNVEADECAKRGAVSGL